MPCLVGIHKEEKDKQIVVDALARTKVLLSNGAREQAFMVLKNVSHSCLDDWRIQFELGVRFFQVGSLDRAEWALRNSLANNFENAQALRYLSSLLYEKGDRVAADRALQAASCVDPITTPTHHSTDKPTVFRLRSTEKSYQGITWNGALRMNEIGLRRGHFSTRALIDRRRVNLYTADFHGDNLIAHADRMTCDILVNTVSCPDLKRGPLSEIEKWLKNVPAIPVLNKPEQVLRTTRLENAQRLGALDGILFPKTIKISSSQPFDEILKRLKAEKMAYPIMIREAGTQTGKSVFLATSEGDLASAINSAASGQSKELYAIQYIDCRDESGYFKKLRAFFIDGTFYPVANLTSDHWQIHSADRYRVMDKLEAAQKEERAYLSDPWEFLGAERMRCLAEVERVVGLDFFGIDFFPHPSGKTVIFEANAAMRHNFDHADNFAYTRPFLETISNAFMTMIQQRISFARRLAAG